MDDYVDAIIRVKVPKWQIGEEVSVYFPDTMMKRGKCEILPKGEWKSIGDFVVKCSVCGVESFETPFCPKCGADMRGAE